MSIFCTRNSHHHPPRLHIPPFAVITFWFVALYFSFVPSFDLILFVLYIFSVVLVYLPLSLTFFGDLLLPLQYGDWLHKAIFFHRKIAKQTDLVHNKLMNKQTKKRSMASLVIKRELVLAVRVSFSFHGFRDADHIFRNQLNESKTR